MWLLTTGLGLVAVALVVAVVELRCRRELRQARLEFYKARHPSQWDR